MTIVLQCWHSCGQMVVIQCRAWSKVSIQDLGLNSHPEEPFQYTVAGTGDQTCD